jgi:hypothetical protein
MPLTAHERATGASALDGNPRPGNGLVAALMREAGVFLPGCSMPDVVLLKTEPHVVAKYGFLADQPVPTIELTHLRRNAVGAVGRWRAGVALRRELERRRDELARHRVFIFDVSEGWFGTTMHFHVRELFPGAVLIGLQHGVMELTGPESVLWVRRARVLFSRAQCRLTGAAAIGAGFGNNFFHVYVCYGRAYRDYIHRLRPNSRVLIDFASLTRADASRARAQTVPFDLLFLGQALSAYGIRGEEAIHRRVLDRLRQVASHRNLRVRVKLHPKQQLSDELVRSFPEIEFVRHGELSDMLSTGLAAVLSFNSTGLVEAAHVGCRIAAIRVPGVAAKYNDAFDRMIDLDDFVASWDVDAESVVRHGEID